MPITLVQADAALSLTVAPSEAPTVLPASTDPPARWNTGEVDVQSHRPSEKKRNWDKDKGEAPVVSPAPAPLVEESPEVVVELSRSGGWESALPEAVAPVVEAAAPVVEKVIPQEDTRPEWVKASESITFVNPPTPSPSTWQDTVIESLTRSQSLCPRSLRRPLMFFLTQPERKATSAHMIVSCRPDRAAGLPHECRGSALGSRRSSGPVFPQRDQSYCWVWGWHSPVLCWGRSASE